MTQTVPMLAPFAEAASRGEPLPPVARQKIGLGTAEDVAPLFVFLGSDQSHKITGQCIGIGGDRLAVWAPPSEADHALADGGWTAASIADALNGSLAPALQDVGIDFT
jgi:3-oxoacyl-[acyl-carrier protein] reductase